MIIMKCETEKIAAIIAEYYSISVEDIINNKKPIRSVIECREMISYLLNKYYNIRTERIAALLEFSIKTIAEDVKSMANKLKYDQDRLNIIKKNLIELIKLELIRECNGRIQNYRIDGSPF